MNDLMEGNFGTLGIPNVPGLETIFREACRLWLKMTNKYGVDF